MGGVSDHPPDMSILAGHSAVTHVSSGAGGQAVVVINCKEEIYEG